MKKIILIALLPITIVMAGSYIMTEGSPLRKADTIVTSPDTSTPDNTTNPLPTQPFNVLDYGLKGDGITDDSAALKELAKNTSVTNWYFPAGKTFKLYDVEVTSHVVAIFGGGTIRSYDNGNTNTETSLSGAIDLCSYSRPDGFIVDGLTFDAPNFTSHKDYGMIKISSAYPSNNMEIRNCIFKNSSTLNGIKGFTRTDDGKIHTNLRIYDNEFIDIGGYFAIELINSNDGDSYPGLRVYGNHIHGSGDGISIIKSQGTTSRIYNNLLEDIGMGIETAACEGTHVYNNTILNNTGQAISDGANTWGGTSITTKKVYIHHNHIELASGGYVYFYGGTTTEFYENYVKGNILVRLQGDYEASGTQFGNIHNNTIVNTPDNGIYASRAVEISGLDGDLMDDGVLQDNDIYTTVSDGDAIRVNYSTLGVEVKNNNLYLIGTGTCISGSGTATETDNTCVNNYKGTFPDGREGAGHD